MSLYDASHPDPMCLIDYAAGRLDRSQAALVRDHCMRCETCGDQLAAIIILRRSEAMERAPAQRFSRVRRAGLGVAAAAVVTLALILGTRGTDQDNLTTVSLGGERAAPVATARLSPADPRKLRTLGLLMKLGRGSAGEVQAVDSGGRRALWDEVADLLVTGHPGAVSRLPSSDDGVADPVLPAVRAIAAFAAGSRDAGTLARLKSSAARPGAGPDEDALRYVVARAAAYYLAQHYLETGRFWKASAFLARVATADDLWSRDAGRLLARNR